MKAICILPNHGYVIFSQCCKKHTVKVHFKLHGFMSNATHAIHIHEFGDLSDGCTSLGPHYNPDNTTHGSREIPENPRHAGDLINNFTTNEDGEFKYTYIDKLLSIDDIVGRSVVIHEGIDDLGVGKGSSKKESLVTGNAGNRICCGIIGWKKN